MKDRIVAFLFGYPSRIVFVIITSFIFIIYYGVYAFLGNKVITKTSGMILLSTETSVANIAIGIICIFYILKK